LKEEETFDEWCDGMKLPHRGRGILVPVFVVRILILYLWNKLKPKP
jgi:hypothetical protein